MNDPTVLLREVHDELAAVELQVRTIRPKGPDRQRLADAVEAAIGHAALGTEAGRDAAVADLTGAAGVTAEFRDDAGHPNARAVARAADTALPELRAIVWRAAPTVSVARGFDKVALSRAGQVAQKVVVARSGATGGLLTVPVTVAGLAPGAVAATLPAVFFTGDGTAEATVMFAAWSSLGAAAAPAAKGRCSLAPPAGVALGAVPAFDFALAPPPGDDVRPFGPTAPWNVPVAGLPLDSRSAALAARLWAASDRPGDVNLTFEGFTYPVFDAREAAGPFPCRLAAGAQGNLDGQPVPWNPAWRGASGSDGQAIVLDPDTGREWNLWRVSFDGSAVRASNGSLVPGSYLTNEGGWPPSRGCGIPYLAMLVRPAEVAAGVIPHALSMPIGPRAIHSTLFVPPATKTDGDLFGVPDGVPEGTRFALRVADTEIEAWAAARAAAAPPPPPPGPSPSPCATTAGSSPTTRARRTCSSRTGSPPARPGARSASTRSRPAASCTPATCSTGCCGRSGSSRWRPRPTRCRPGERLARRAVAIGEKTLGPDHPDLATWLNDLAGLCRDAGRYAEDEPPPPRWP